MADELHPGAFAVNLSSSKRLKPLSLMSEGCNSLIWVVPRDSVPAFMQGLFCCLVLQKRRKRTWI